VLKKITKRNGEVEEFIPSKLNKWIQWAQGDLAERVDWSGIVTEAVKNLGEQTTSAKLQSMLIDLCIKKADWPHNLMAGRLFAANLHKKLYPNGIPKVKELHQKLIKKGLMVDLGYSDSDYEFIENNIIDHDRDFNLAQFQIKHINSKYSIQNRGTKKTYETPQFTYLRMAMALSQDFGDNKLAQVKSYYDDFSENALSAPTPNYVNLGTKLKGYASCCLFKSDDNIDSLAIGDYIAYKMTAQSAGLGSIINTRSIGDKVRGGAIEHQGKYLYTKSRAAASKANQQAGRGGAANEYYTAYDPEASMLARIQNPRTPVDKRNRDIHFTMISNTFFCQKVMKNEKVFTFTSHSAPDLWEAIFAKDPKEFEVLYLKYENDKSFKKNYISAREFILEAIQQSYEVGTHYLLNATEVNRHSPFIEPIYTSNLCLEVCLPTQAYYNMIDLLSEKDNGYVTLKDSEGEYDFPYSDPIDGKYPNQRTFYGNLTNENVKDYGFDEVIKKVPTSEIALCSLFAVVLPKIKDDDHYRKVVRNGLLMIDWCIHNSDYPLAHVGWTAKQRLNAGIGIIGLATVLAEKGLTYGSQEGRNEIHKIAERHAYICIEQSLQLGIELGNAPWMHKTLWPKGWLPIDTYKKEVDSLVTVGLQYDWEDLRSRIISNGGIRNSSLIAHMPTEASSKAVGQPNGPYPIRFLNIKKSDQNNIIDWVAPDSDILKDKYQTAWDLSIEDQIKFYSIIQKFTDQSISADFYSDRTNGDLLSIDLITDYITMFKYGMKSRYYMNSLVAVNESTQKEEVCTSGTCDV
jgi:ribonucleoside-diphosphate reductase alpha chain